jgi:putative DNA primase/helicase
VIASNETLSTTDYTSGLERRRITVPFERVITTREKEAWRKAGGENILHEEAAGIINWVLSMPLENVARIIHSPPPSIIAANAEAMRDSNSVVDWLMENCIPAFGVWTPIGIKEEIREYGQSSFISDKQHLYPNYLRYCQQTGKQPLSLQRFSAKAIDMLRNCLNTDVFKVRRNNGMGIAGIRLREGNEEAHNWQKQ